MTCSERALIVALAIGFFVTLVVAWYHGEKGVQRASGMELLILALLLAIGGGVLWRVANAPGEAAVPASGNADHSRLVVVDAIPASDKSIAVLPFANLSRDPDNAYFADGMQDEILTKLAKISALRVVSRTSTQRFASTGGKESCRDRTTAWRRQHTGRQRAEIRQCRAHHGATGTGRNRKTPLG